MIIALDFKFEQRSPRPRSLSQRFLSAACIYNLALLLIYSDLTQVKLHNIRRRISCERVISVFVTQEQRVLRKIVIFIIQKTMVRRLDFFYMRITPCRYIVYRDILAVYKYVH